MVTPVIENVQKHVKNKNTHQRVETKSKIGLEIQDFYVQNVRFVDVVILKNDQITPEHHGKSFHPLLGM